MRVDVEEVNVRKSNEQSQAHKREMSTTLPLGPIFGGDGDRKGGLVRGKVALKAVGDDSRDGLSWLMVVVAAAAAIAMATSLRRGVEAAGGREASGGELRQGRERPSGGGGGQRGGTCGREGARTGWGVGSARA